MMGISWKINSAEKLGMKKNKHGIYKLYICDYCEFLNLHVGLKIDSFFKMWKVNISITALKKSLKMV